MPLVSALAKSGRVDAGYVLWIAFGSSLRKDTGNRLNHLYVSKKGKEITLFILVLGYYPG